MTAKEEKKGKDAIEQIDFHEMTAKELTREGGLQEVAAKFKEILKDTGCDNLYMRFPDPIADGEAGTVEANSSETWQDRRIHRPLRGRRHHRSGNIVWNMNVL